ncbi:MAG TPA: cell wall-binding repeat-containing protein, partial [Agrococcus sp.]|nr:cell wall-binding repeat-containing protein [Agrococcus sp.]
DAEPQPTEPAAEAEPQPTEPAHEAEAAPQSTQPAPDVAAAAAEAQAIDAASTDPVLRLGGANRYETSRLIALHAFDSAASAFVATGVRFPDALAAGPAAAHRNGPVLLVDGERDALDSATRATLAELGVGWVGIAGDTASVSAGVATGLDAAVTTVRRYAGTNRYATAAQLSTVFGAADVAYVASGQNFPDALSGAAAAGAQDAPMLLARHSCMPDDTSDALLGFMPNEVLVLGGTPTLSPDAARYTSCD